LSSRHIKGDESVDSRVHLLNARKTALQQLHGRERPAADEAARFTSREVARFSQGSSLSLRVSWAYSVNPALFHAITSRPDLALFTKQADVFRPTWRKGLHQWSGLRRRR
jgi:hypothetical protein